MVRSQIRDLSKQLNRKLVMGTWLASSNKWSPVVIVALIVFLSAWRLHARRDGSRREKALIKILAVLAVFGVTLQAHVVPELNGSLRLVLEAATGVALIVGLLLLESAERGSRSDE
jgi:hypothetical protein